jgi:hypothetical protein
MKTSQQNGRRPQKYKNGRWPQKKMEDYLNKMEDNLKKIKMEDDLKQKNGRRPQQIKDDLQKIEGYLREMEDDLKTKKRRPNGGGEMEDDKKKWKMTFEKWKNGGQPQAQLKKSSFIGCGGILDKYSASPRDMKISDSLFRLMIYF